MSLFSSAFPHGGNLRWMAQEAGCSPDQLLDFSANINPLGMPDWLRQTISVHISSLIHYPDPKYTSLKNAIASRYSLPSSRFVVGNGASEILQALPRVLKITHALLPVPCYAGYEKALLAQGAQIIPVELLEQNEFDLDLTDLQNRLHLLLERSPDLEKKGVAVFLASPNNPTGRILDLQDLKLLLEQFSKVWFILDESFADFTDPQVSAMTILKENLILVRSMTKILAIPGLRIGFAIASEEIAERIQQDLPTWTVNTLASAVLERAMEETLYFEKTREQINRWREELLQDLNTIPALKCFQSTANFILIKLDDPEWNTDSLRLRLLTDFKLGIRSCSNMPGLSSRYFRVAVKRPEENHRLIESLNSLLSAPSGPQRRIRCKKKTPAIMFQGTGSNVGKSILATALCRILYQDGIKVAPFKAQNMALNSFVTPDGGEIGRAQALQAQAAKLLPDVRMNPVLLKPSSDSQSQVILKGRPVAHMDFRNYSTYKAEVFESVKQAYDSLSSEFDAVVLEGAGSASEVNLKHNEIVNMRMAKHAGASVLLVGNIDPGGVFGAFVGTLETMAEWERDLVAGFVINRFRGIKELLQDGVDYLHRYTRKSVFGIVPHIKGLNLPEEDSLEFKSGALNDETPLNGRLDVVLIDTPRISNFTDVDALRGEPDVRVRQIRCADELGAPDVLILPGSKNVVTDLKHLQEGRMVDRIQELAKMGKTQIVGICGGLQILGQTILDPNGIETGHASFQGMGLLPVESTLEKDKTLRQTRGVHVGSGLSVSGYEIHHGQTRWVGNYRPKSAVAFRSDPGEELGFQSEDGMIWGTYLHGIFDADDFRRAFINGIRARKGLKPLGIQVKYEWEASLDELAKQVRESLEMKRIYEKLRL